MKFGIIADDNTGATDAAGMLTEKGVRTVLTIGIPCSSDFEKLKSNFDAVVLGLETRSTSAEDAYGKTKEAVTLLAKHNIGKIQIKYCSTFDSKPDGNIGQTLDAAIDVLNVPATIICPALPVNGRTTYFGYHFVNGQLLSESPLKDHPINPMTDSNLVRWLGYQSKRKVSLINLHEIRKGRDSLTELFQKKISNGDVYFVTDAINQSDIGIIAQATLDWPLLSGGSGITAEVAELLFPERTHLCFKDRIAGCPRGTLVVAGSCAPMTREQNSWALKNGFEGLEINGINILKGKIDIEEKIDKAFSSLSLGKNVLIFSSAKPDEIENVQKFGLSLGLDKMEVGEKIAQTLSRISAYLIKNPQLGKLVVAGGETSKHVCHKLGFNAFEVGLPIEPSVPYCFPLERKNLLVLLKSGNFGSKELFVNVCKITR